ncbi:LysE family translocator [Streptomyces sioyaensis]|uniref:LysE family translocator n=1 Tax=Streptomyces sioyaensis TaxID=67364 RepID=UPI0037142B49
MSILASIWSFALVVGLLTIIPGLDTAIILRTSVLGNYRRAWGVVLGIQSGTLFWGTCTSLGITALLTASQVAYNVVRWAGAAYLLWMGFCMLRDSIRKPEGEGESTEAAEVDEIPNESGGLLAGWRRGALTNVLNPKVGVFYVAMLPQFIPVSAPHLPMGVLLTCVHVALGTLWSAMLVVFARSARRWIQRPLARRLLDRVTGVVILGFGIVVALSDS